MESKSGFYGEQESWEPLKDVNPQWEVVKSPGRLSGLELGVHWGISAHLHALDSNVRPKTQH